MVIELPRDTLCTGTRVGYPTPPYIYYQLKLLGHASQRALPGLSNNGIFKVHWSSPIVSILRICGNIFPRFLKLGLANILLQHTSGSNVLILLEKGGS